MAYIKIPGWPISYPSIFGGPFAPSIASGARTIDAATEKVAWSLRAPKDGVINRVGFLVGTVTQNPTNGLTVSLQDLDASGNPDGTQDQTRVVVTGSIAADSYVTTGLLTSDGTDTGTKRTVTAGQELAVVVEFATFVAGDSLAINVGGGGAMWGHSTPFQPINLHNVGGTWGSRQSSGPQNIAVQYSDGTWEPIPHCIPIETSTAVAMISTSNPDERGMSFICPVAMRAVGFSIHGYFQLGSSTAKLHLYDSANVELASATVADPDSFAGLNASGVVSFPFDAVADSVEMATGGTYKVTIEATGAGQVALHGYVPDSSAFTSAMPWGEDASAISRQNTTGAFTVASDGTQYAIGLLIDAIDPVKASLFGRGMLQGLPPFMRSFLR